jgi:RNA polymerase sigma-70 factor (ECF subfamily)
MLRSARAGREEYVGPWLPELVVDTAALASDGRTEAAEDLSIALLLTPRCCSTMSSTSH